MTETEKELLLLEIKLALRESEERMMRYLDCLLERQFSNK